MQSAPQKFGEELFKRILVSLKKLWIVILILTLIGGVAGYFYSNTLVPLYTSSCKTMYMAKAISSSSYKNVTVTNTYADTFLDFCDEGCVLERANYYYREFKNSTYYTDYLNNPNKTQVEGVEAYLLKVRADYRTSADKYAGENTYGNDDIKKGNMSVYRTGEENSSDFTIFVNYVDTVPIEATFKAKILITAIELEANTLKTPGGTFSKYFGNATMYLNDLSDQGLAYGSLNKNRVIMIWAIVGFILSLGVIFVINICDRTIRNRDELERITGASVFAYITYREE